MKLYESYKNWEQFDGRVVKIEGYNHRIKVRVQNGIYPYPRKLIDVSAVPMNKNSNWYQETKKLLGDDWSTDVLDSDIDLQCSILEQLSERN